MYLYKNGLLSNSFRLTVTYIHVMLYKVTIPSVCLLQDKCKEIFTSFSRAQNFNSLSSEIQNASSTALLNNILILSHFSLVKTHLSSPNACVQFFASFALFFFSSFILALFFLTFSFSFLHLHVQPFLFLSYLMIIFYVPNKLCILRVKVSSRVKNHHFSKFAIFRRLNRAHQELSFKKNVFSVQTYRVQQCFLC